jgi:PHD/YefM family antitoxin component YafN of YafNO toxin-antitoxin module
MVASVLDISDARRIFSTLDRRLAQERVIRVRRHNRDAFVLVDLEYWNALLETLEVLSDPDALKMLQESLDDIRTGKLIPYAEVAG